jgi:23S rRNA (uracil1939-C5)-methyltransferase
MPNRGDLVDVEVTKTALGGSGLGEADGLKIFVNRGIPGQTVKVRLTKHKKKYAEGKTQEVLQTSDLEVEAKCPYFASSKRINEGARNCGGCLWQHLPYEKQLEMKEAQVKETLEHVGKFKNLEIRPIIGSPHQWHYRNKIELSFGHPSRILESGEKVFDGADFGFRQLGMFREVVPIEECVIFDPELPPVIDAIRRYVQMQDWEVFDFDKRPDGFWQYLILRRGVNTGEWMINFITRPGQTIDGHLVTELKDVLGDKLQSVLHTVNFGKAINYAGHDNKKVEVLFGRDYILEEVGEFQFTISPFSFFQTNTGAAKMLYDVIKEAAALTGKEKVLDMYCGTGTIGQYLAKDAREVIGVEILKEAIADAEVNARNNRLANCRYVTGDAAKILHFQRGKFLNVDCVIMDPPRAGIAKKGLMSILKLAAPKIVYVSCNPSTLARDLEMMCSKRYAVQWVQPVDLFPHTGHVESVVVLERVRS